ncbi:MAG TPA: hypothetical protein VIM33_08795 [Gaiellaceae bacterium]
MPQTRKTRGPRTPEERAHDAARSTATRFEKLPESHFADEVLKPLAALLRFYTCGFKGSGVMLRELRQLENAERGFLDFMNETGWAIEYMPVAEGLRVEQTVQRVQGALRDAKAQLAAQLAEKADDA